MKLEDLIAVAIEKVGGVGKLADIYEAMQTTKAFETVFARGSDWKAQTRERLQRCTLRFVKGDSKGVWALARRTAIENIRRQVAGIKLKHFRIRKEGLILDYFMFNDSGTASGIVEYANKDYKNKQGGKAVQVVMTTRECGQLLKRMSFVKVDGEWRVPPTATTGTPTPKL
jgi:hypothetical protein